VKPIQDKAVAASGAAGKCVVLPVPNLPAHLQYLVYADGKVDAVDIEPQPRSHELGSLDEAIGFINAKATEASVVWFDCNRVVVVLDDATRRDVACLRLVYSDTLRLLRKIEEDHTRFDQQEFRRLLRVDLVEARTDDRLLNWVSNAKFATATTVGGKLTTTSESLGRDINDAALSTAGEMPEEIGLDVRIFDDVSLKETWGVRCAVELFIREAEFTLTPYPLALHDAISAEVDVIGQKLRAAVKVPVFRGKP
jgi:hypothetical protein